MTDLTVGEGFILNVKIDQQKVDGFACLTGDDNPIHSDSDYAASTIFQQPIAHGLLVASFFSTIFGRHFPGEGSIYLSQDIRFVKPVFINSVVKYCVSITEVVEEKSIYVFSTKAFVGDTLVIDGAAKVLFKG